MADMFIKFDGVDGESKAVGHEGWIELLSFGVAATTPGSASMGEGAGVGKPTIQDPTFVTQAGRHTPQLEANFYKGRHFATAEVHFTKLVGENNPQTYYFLKMEEVFITSHSSDKAPDGLATEMISIQATKYEREYMVQGPDGSLTSVGGTKYHNKEQRVEE